MIDILMTWGLGIFLIFLGFNLGMLWSEQQLEAALRLLQEAKKIHQQFHDELRKLQEQARK